MNFEVVREWESSGLHCILLRVEIKSMRTFYNGYVGVGEDHPLYKVNHRESHPATAPLVKRMSDAPVGKRGVIRIFLYTMDLQLSNPEAKPPPLDVVFDVHGSITFSGSSPVSKREWDPPLWWFGFDTNHAGDEHIQGDLTYVAAETEKLARQLAEVKSEGGGKDGLQ